jgi:LCP family protein required for cell wall assembly
MTPSIRRQVPRTHRRRGTPLWARLAVAAGVLLMVASGGSILAGRLLLARYAGDITHDGGLGTAAVTGQPGGTTIGGPVNLLLVGIDERAGLAGARADSIIVAHVPATHDAVYFASIPRDTKVTIPGHGTGKVNAAFEVGSGRNGGREGGLSLLAETVGGLAGGLKFNGAAIINFDGLRDLVRALGGVRMYVDERVTSIHIGEDLKTGKVGVPYVIHADGTPGPLKPNMRPQVYEVGWHEFSDWQALDYVRQRDLLAGGDGDYGRQRHQQQFLRAVVDKATGTGVLANPVKVNAVLTSLGKALSFYNNGVDLADWLFTFKDLRPDDVVMLKTNAGVYNPLEEGGVAYELLSPDTRQLLTAMTTDTVGRFVAEHPTWVST